jgi:hypothetical protein
MAPLRHFAMDAAKVMMYLYFRKMEFVAKAWL